MVIDVLATQGARAGFTIDIWKQRSFENYDLKNNFINMNKDRRMTTSFIYKGDLIDLRVICTYLGCKWKTCQGISNYDANLVEPE